MVQRQSQISERSIIVLEMIAAGSAYDQILAAYPDLTYLDIFRAPQETLDALARKPQTLPQSYTEIRDRHSRAYEKWSTAEEVQLHELIRAGFTVARIAGRLQRQRSAIRSRILRLGPVRELSSKEQARLIHISKLDPTKADLSDP